MLLFAWLVWAGCSVHLGPNVDIGEIGARHQLSERVRRNSTGERVQVQARKMASGYNCKAYVWLGRSDLFVLAVFDTGATRGSIDFEFLKTR